jgi:hypothetical protein
MPRIQDAEDGHALVDGFETADVILVGMGQHEEIDPPGAESSQEGHDDLATRIPVAEARPGIEQDPASPRGPEYRSISLSNV